MDRGEKTCHNILPYVYNIRYAIAILPFEASYSRYVFAYFCSVAYGRSSNNKWVYFTGRERLILIDESLFPVLSIETYELFFG